MTSQRRHSGDISHSLHYVTPKAIFKKKDIVYFYSFKNSHSFFIYESQGESAGTKHHNYVWWFRMQ